MVAARVVGEPKRAGFLLDRSPKLNSTSTAGPRRSTIFVVSSTMRYWILATLLSTCSLAATPDAIRSAGIKAVDLVQGSQKTWFSKQSCSSCHNQILPALAFRVARQHGLPLNETVARADAAKAFAAYSNLDRAIQYTHVIDPALDDGYRLLAADAAGVKPNLSTAVYARFIASRQQSDGHWSTIDVRPPESHSFITATAISLRALELYGHPSLASDTRERVERARQWLAAQHPADTEERVYQMLGLFWAGAPHSALTQPAAELVATQEVDGGWNSVAGRLSDAYSTAQALVALHDAGCLPTTDPHWARGLQYLLDTQKPDGSWHVASRLVSPAQVSPPYFETGYPYGHDQFISLMAASWSIMAFADALGPAHDVGVPPLTEAAPAAVEPWIETVLFGSAADLQNLLDNHFDPNSATKAGTTALMMAAPDLEKTKLLVAAGADVNARTKTRYSALLVAAQYPDSTPTIKFLLEHGAEVRLPKGAGKPLFNATALSLATMAGNAEAIPLFLSRGDRFDEVFFAVGAFPFVPADEVVASDDTRTLAALLNAGMPVDLAAADGMTLLGNAVLANRLNAAQLLISRGADVNHVDQYGLTPLQIAASIDFGDARMIELLKKAGAQSDKRDRNGLTALELARKYQHANLIASLQN